MVSIVKAEGNSVLSPLFAGLVYAMVVAVTATILISLLLTLTGLREQSLPLYVYMIHGISVFTGGFICAKRAGVKGWYRGGLLGVFYCLLVTLIAYLGFDAQLDLDTLVFLVICSIIGAFGGILGINAKR
ncbi:MAG: TIGR04086 family membrane protein [Paenibacillaceae bacterium]